MKEHSGGAPRSTILVSEWRESQFAVQIHGVVDFDFTAMDKPEDHVRELVERGQPIGPFLDKLFEPRLRDSQRETISWVMAFVSASKRPALTCDRLAWISGMALLDGRAATHFAKRHGISKQAFCQGALKIADQFHIRPPQAMRDSAAKQKFSSSNYRRNGNA